MVMFSKICQTKEFNYILVKLRNIYIKHKITRKIVIKVTGYPCINFMGANSHCLEKQPYCVLYRVVWLSPSKYCIKSLQTLLIGH